MDLTKIHKDHREIVESIISDEFGVGYTDKQKQQVYDTYLKLSAIPKKDWNKQSTVETLNVKIK